MAAIAWKRFHPYSVGAILYVCVATSGGLGCSSTKPPGTAPVENQPDPADSVSQPPPDTVPRPPQDTATVSAGPDVEVSSGQTVTLRGRAPDGWKIFWTVVTGPGPVEFGHTALWADGKRVSDFEDGTWNAWIADDGGNETGSSRVSSSRAHTGVRSWEAWNDPQGPGSDQDRISAKLLRFRVDYPEAYYQGWMYWPSSYLTSSGKRYVNLFQWKERASPWNPTWILAVVPDEENRDVFAVHDAVGQRVTRTGTSVPKDRWVHIAAWLKASRTAGELWLWVDGQLIARRAGINTLGGPTNTGPGGLMWGIGNYGGVAIGRSVWWDDAQVAQIGPTTTSATFKTAGQYLVQVTASDGTTSRTDQATIIVR